MGGADLFRAAYPSAQAAALYTQHPITRLALAELKALLDWRQGYAEKARSLEAFYAKHDLGNGTVRVCACVHLASTERATARVKQEESAGRRIRHHPRPGQASVHVRLGPLALCRPNPGAPRSLQGCGPPPQVGAPHECQAQVRIEDFKAGLSLGGVKVSPSQVHSIRGAFGNADGTVRWQEVLEGLDNLGHRQGLSIIMTHKMGPTTARHLGYTEVRAPGKGVQRDSTPQRPLGRLSGKAPPQPRDAVVQ